jgi:hypothetical protein
MKMAGASVIEFWDLYHSRDLESVAADVYSAMAELAIVPLRHGRNRT